MVAAAKKKSKKPKYTAIAVSPETKAAFAGVCEYRGWSGLECVKRLVARELSLIEQESQSVTKS